MGGKGGSSTPSINYGALSSALNNLEVKPSPYEQSLANIANQYWSMTSPVRGYMLEDFNNFLRPPGYTTTSTQANNSPTSSSGTSTIPTYNDIYKNVNELYTAAAPTGVGRNNWDFNYAPGQRDYMIDMGYDPFAAKNMQEVSALPLENGVPVGLDQFVKNKSQSIFNDQVAKALENKQSSGTTATTQPSSGLTSSSLYNPYNLPGYAPLYQLARTGLESQYNPARENIMASTPRGGALYENLAGLEMSRAQQAGELPATIAAPLISDIYNKAYGVAFQSPQTSIAGLSAANQGLSSRTGAAYGLAGSMYGANSAAAMQQAAMNQQATMGLGAGLGNLAGMGLKAANTGGKSSAAIPAMAATSVAAII